MKLVVNNMGKFLVVAIAAALVLVFISASLLPSLSAFVSNTFIKETNYVEKGDLPSAPILESDFSIISSSAGESIDLFAHITATSRSGEDLIQQLKDDHEKEMSERSQVFVYRINSDNTNTLVSDIDITKPGNWVVLYLLKDGTENKMLKVQYRIS